jgi:hypothetical protein
MQSLNAIALAPDVRIWLAHTRRPRLLHVFDRACNLINERSEVLSVVTPQIGNGPFNLVLGEELVFPETIRLQSPVSHTADSLRLGHLVIHAANAKFWDPCPDWEKLHASKHDIAAQLAKLPITNYMTPAGLDTSLAIPTQGSSASAQALISHLSSSLAVADLASSLSAARQLAGLGIGLTPAGDDLILGALYAAWIIHPPEVAGVLAQEIANGAAPLTTSLSAAWLRSAGKGEAGILWHQFFESLLAYPGAAPSNPQEAMEDILSMGETSGADSLAGFIGLFHQWREHPSNL